MIILDTNVISELMRPAPDENVSRWIAKQKTINLAVTSITVAEIRRGLSRLLKGKRRKDLEARFTVFIDEGFKGRILPFDEYAAETYGEIASSRLKKGLHCDVEHLMIASIAYQLNAAIATSHIEDFDRCGLKLINPWK